MIDQHQQTRLKVSIDEYFTILVIAFVLIAAVGCWATYSTLADPSTTEEQYVQSSWQTAGEFNHTATVESDTPVLEEGDVYVNESIYLTNGTPVLDGWFGFQFGGAPGNATVTTETTLVNYAYHEGLETRLWETREPLDTDRQQVQSGEMVDTNFSVDVAEIRDYVERVEGAHESSIQQSDVRTDIAVDVTVEGTIADEPVNESFTYTLPINSTEGYYVVHPPRDDDHRFSIMGQQTVTDEPSTFASVASLLLLFAPLAVLGGLYYGRENDWFVVSAEAQAEAQRERVRSDFDDWISAGSVTDDDRMVVDIASLEDLVDVAIDADRRVVEDTDTNTYVVLDDDVRYRFVPEWSEKLEDGLETEFDEEETPEAEGDGEESSEVEERSGSDAASADDTT